MAGAEAGTDGESASAIALGSGGSGAQKLVSDLGHGADDDDSLFAGGDAACDDGGGTVDGGRVFHRSAAEFHHDQAHAFLFRPQGLKPLVPLEAQAEARTLRSCLGLMRGWRFRPLVPTCLNLPAVLR